MRAAYCRAYGPPEAVRVEEVVAPPVAAGQVRVRIEAAAVNFPDVLMVANRYQISVPVPFVPGSEFSGTVVEVGSGAVGVAPGDRVAGTVMVGAFADEIVVGAASLWPVPASVDARHAAAFGVAHRTAYHVLRSVAKVQPGEHVVVLGAGGGVGLATVALATLLGAQVTAVASSRAKLDAALAAGATTVIDRRAGDLRAALKADVPDGADVVVDPVGGDCSEPALRALRWGGRFVTVGYASGEIPRIPLNLVLLKGVVVMGFEFGAFMTNATDDMARNETELLDLLAAGRVLPHVGASFPLDDVAAALRLVADGEAVGKVVIDTT